MKTNSFKNLILTLVCLLGITVNVAANISGTEHLNKENRAYVKYVCDNDANTVIDLALDVIGNGFSAEAGKWELVENDVTSLDVEKVDYSKKVIADAKNVFVLSGKLPGEYTFLFTATGVSACIPVGHKRLAKVVILETPKNLSTGLSLCPGETGSIDLKTIVPASLKNVVFTLNELDEVGTLDNQAVFRTTANFKGVASVTYKITYKDVVATENLANGATAKDAACTSEGIIRINVSRDKNAPKLKGKSPKTYCVNEVPSALNLNTFLSSLAPKGKWSMNTAVASGVTLEENSDKLIFKREELKSGEYTFTYSYEKPSGNCYEAGTVDLTIKITDKLSSDFVDGTLSVCKNNRPNEIINMLRDGLNIDIPLSSGTWKMIKQVTPIVVSDGLFEVEQARAGEYEYEFKVSTAAKICGLAGKKANLTIKVVDPNATQDGRMQYCIADLINRKGNFKLADLVPYLPSTGVEWTKIGADFDSFNSKDGMVSYEELSKAGKGTYKFIYTYNAGECGKATGNVYLAVTDNLDVVGNIVLRYCRPDMPELINLAQAIGVDVEGSWEVTEGEGVLDTQKRTFKEKENKSGDQTYILKFTPNEKSCVKVETISVTIKVSDNKFE